MTSYLSMFMVQRPTESTGIILMGELTLASHCGEANPTRQKIMDVTLNANNTFSARLSCIFAECFV